MAAPRRKRTATATDDDLPVRPTLPPDDEDDDGEDGYEDDDGDDEVADEPEVDAELGIRHARNRTRALSARGDDDTDDDSDQVIPDRIVPLPLPQPWRHLKLWVWLDYPEDVAQLFVPRRDDETTDEAGERIIEGLRTVVVKHGGWRDRDGHKLPQPGSRRFWARISTPLSNAIIQALFAMVKRNPTQPASRKPKRRR